MKLIMSTADDKLLDGVDREESEAVRSAKVACVITRIAGICGVIAVALGAYGFHGKRANCHQPGIDTSLGSWIQG